MQIAFQVLNASKPIQQAAVTIFEHKEIPINTDISEPATGQFQALLTDGNGMATFDIDWESFRYVVTGNTQIGLRSEINYSRTDRGVLQIDLTPPQTSQRTQIVTTEFHRGAPKPTPRNRF